MPWKGVANRRRILWRARAIASDLAYPRVRLSWTGPHPPEGTTRHLETIMAESKQRELRDVSDRLLDALKDIRDLEEQKRTEEISTPAFHRLTDDVAHASRRVFELAHEEDAVSDSFDERQRRSVEETPPSRS